MQSSRHIWSKPAAYLSHHQPDTPTAFVCPRNLRTSAQGFMDGFPGLVTYAVKANPDADILTNLHLSGLRAFDVASPIEIDLVRRHAPGAVMHYNNPVRSEREIAYAVAAGVASYSVDHPDELQKLLAQVPQNAEIAVRLKLPVAGAAYDFGDKFGATPDECTGLLQQVAAAGRQVAMTFHPGTQCTAPDAWVAYIVASAEIARRAGVNLRRLNVGGGFPAHRGEAPALTPIFETIARVARAALPDVDLLCEPGRAMVADAVTIATRIKAVRGATIFLNDGLYGTLAELRDDMPTARYRVLTAHGTARTGNTHAVSVFGPTCDSLDRLPDPLHLPNTIEEGDYLLFDGMGAYGTALATRFNGYGMARQITVSTLD